LLAEISIPRRLFTKGGREPHKKFTSLIIRIWMSLNQQKKVSSLKFSLRVYLSGSKLSGKTPGGLLITLAARSIIGVTLEQPQNVKKSSLNLQMNEGWC